MSRPVAKDCLRIAFVRGIRLRRTPRHAVYNSGQTADEDVRRSRDLGFRENPVTFTLVS